jgi:ribonuclease P protein component
VIARQLTTHQRARSNTALFRIGRHGNEAHLPAVENTTRKNARIPCPQSHPRRTQSHREPPRQGPASARALAADGKPQGLDAARRLRNKAEFEHLLRHGTRRSVDGITFFLATRDAGGPRLGLLVTRKHAPHATDRNRLKRCIREAFRLEQQALGPLDMLVRPPYGARGDARMLIRLRQALQKLAAR